MAGDFCPKCGAQRVGEFRFCRSCGFDFDALPAPTVVDAPPPPTEAPSVSSPAFPHPVPEVTGAAERSKRPWVVLGVVIFVAILAAAGFIGLSNSGALAARHDITGTFTLIDTDLEFSGISTSGDTCEGDGGYSDINQGVEVTVRDGTGKLLQTGSLGEGTGNLVRCEFPFTIKGVPETDFYSVEVGSRGDLSYSLDDMKANAWTLGFQLGD